MRGCYAEMVMMLLWEMLTIDLFSRLVTLKQVAKKVVKVLNVSFAHSLYGLLGHP